MKGFTQILRVSPCRVKRLLKAMKAGHSAPFQSKRTNPKETMRVQETHADAWLAWCWHALATPLPKNNVSDYDTLVEPYADDTFPVDRDWAVGPSPFDSASASMPDQAGVRGMLKMSFQSFYELYTMTCSGQPASLSTLRRTWVHGNWEKRIHFQRLTYHISCDECAQLREWRRIACDDDDRAKVEAAHEAHIMTIMRDRFAISRMDEIARKSLHGIVPVATLLQQVAMTIDGMDQAKFRVPRWKFKNTPKELESLFRPCLHVHGAIIPGCLETFYICEPDLPEDANLQCTCMGRSLHLVATLSAKKGITMPRQFRVDFDNTAAEGKNNTCLTWYSWLISEGRFDVIDAQSSQVGHTHHIQDQRFSVAATLLSKTERLQRPTAFMDVLKKRVTPLEASLHVEVFASSYDWKEWLAPLNVNWKGHTSTQYTKCIHEIRVFRFTKRHLLSEDMQNLVESEFHESPSPDAIFPKFGAYTDGGMKQ